MSYLLPFRDLDLSYFVTKREGETKLGEKIQLVHTTIEETVGNYVILGIPEDIGPQANMGAPGAKYAWVSFLSKFLNMQSNSLINASSVIVAGEISMEGIDCESQDIDSLRKSVEELDSRVKSVVQEIISCGKIPIIIGGGHNNCFPIIDSFPSPIQVLNIDPHADIRKKEGRHSGNGFTFALDSGKLSHYFVLGLHEEYNSEFILQQFENNENLNFLSFNEILYNDISTKEMINQVKAKLIIDKIGLEIDLDSIKNMPVSAQTPIGFSEEAIRKIITEASKSYDFHYLHICEGAPKTEEHKLIVGKTIAYLVSDFIKHN